MTPELGIVLDPSLDPVALDSLARHAEQRQLDLVVVAGSGIDAALDPWTAVAWIAGSTEHIALGVPSSANGHAHEAVTVLPLMESKAHESLDLLAGTRLVAERGWIEAAPDADLIELGKTHGLPVVVRVGSIDEIDRLASVRDRARAGATASRRSTAARARRQPGIDYEAVPESLADSAVEPGDPSYWTVSSTYMRGGSPGLVLRPTTVEQVADALAFARRHRALPLGIRSGGHGISGRSTNHGGLVIDVGAMNRIDVIDTEQRIVRIEPGATWKQVAAALHPYGWVLGSGDYGGVGVGGLATAGGIGYLSRRHGLTIDHLRAVELVLADGQSVRATRDENPDLFWAMRGAGANFGIATAFEFTADPIDEVGYAQLLLSTGDIAATLEEFGRLADRAPRDTTVFLVAGRPSDGRTMFQLYAMVDSDDPDVIVERLTPFVGLGVVLQQQVVLAHYTDVMNLADDIGPDGHHGRGEPVARSAFLPALTSDTARDLADLLATGDVYFFQLRMMGGAIGDVAADDTAFAHRTPAFQATAMGADQRALNDAWDALAHHFDGLYLSFDTDLRPGRIADAFPPATLRRLRSLKRHYDPDNLFHDNFNIDPSTAPHDLEAA